METAKAVLNFSVLCAFIGVVSSPLWWFSLKRTVIMACIASFILLTLIHAIIKA